MTTPAGPFLELEDAKRVLREGLALLDPSGDSGAAGQDDAGRVAAWGRVMTALQAAPSPEALRGSVSPDRLKEFENKLEEVLRLNAVLVSAVSSEQRQILGRIRKVREARRGMDYYGPVVPEGDRCDISG